MLEYLLDYTSFQRKRVGQNKLRRRLRRKPSVALLICGGCEPCAHQEGKGVRQQGTKQYFLT